MRCPDFPPPRALRRMGAAVRHRGKSYTGPGARESGNSRQAWNSILFFGSRNDESQLVEASRGEAFRLLDSETKVVTGRALNSLKF